MNELKVFQGAPAPPTTSQFLKRVLGPVIVADQFQEAPPLELRPTGVWSGWAAAQNMAPDGRVSLSNLLVFSSASKIVDVYIHEAAHSLIHKIKGAESNHNAAFFAVDMCLRLRADAAGANPRPVALALAGSLYDLSDLPWALSDAPDRGVGRCMTWSITNARELASSRLSAEDLAREVVNRYQVWLAELEDKPRRAGLAAAKATRVLQNQMSTVARLKDTLFVSNSAAAISLVFLFLLGLMRVHV